MTKDDVFVVLGTAHLITTPGKRSPDGAFREAVYSREIVSRVESQLLAQGVKVLIDYPDLEPYKEIVTGSPAEQNSRELAYRVATVNQLCKERGTKNCLYVSIHVNAAGNGSEWRNAGGWSVYTSVGQTRGDKLATCLYEAAKRNLKGYEAWMAEGKKSGAYGQSQRAFRTDTSDGDPDMEANLYVLKNTKCAACLTENLFQDNRSDVAYLTSEEGKAAIVATHVEGIINYIKEEML
jgi:N-acetylmuramoyl-L-alanine amidase